jgi:hypothetical protein
MAAESLKIDLLACNFARNLVEKHTISRNYFNLIYETSICGRRHRDDDIETTT